MGVAQTGSLARAIGPLARPLGQGRRPARHSLPSTVPWPRPLAATARPRWPGPVGQGPLAKVLATCLARPSTVHISLARAVGQGVGHRPKPVANSLAARWPGPLVTSQARHPPSIARRPPVEAGRRPRQSSGGRSPSPTLDTSIHRHRRVQRMRSGCDVQRSWCAPEGLAACRYKP